jgi:hypothetical protein
MEINPKRTKLLACATVIEEMYPFIPPELTYEVLDFGLHLRPGGLRETLQEAIDTACASGNFDTIVLGYGLCSMALIGLKANNCTVITPRVDDCIAIFLGSKKAYTEQNKKEPGTYYLTKGWIEVADTPFNEYENLIPKYGEERAKRIMHTMLKHYKRIVYIDTGHADNRPYIEYARKTAEQFNLQYEEMPGSNTLIQKMLFGPWDEEILVVSPGHTITYMDFRNDSSPTSEG